MVATALVPLRYCVYSADDEQTRRDLCRRRAHRTARLEAPRYTVLVQYSVEWRLGGFAFRKCGERDASIKEDRLSPVVANLQARILFYNVPPKYPGFSSSPVARRTVVFHSSRAPGPKKASWR